MSEIIRQYNIYVNSSQMVKQGKSSYTIYLPGPLTLNQIIPSEFKVYIDRAQIPFSWSQFSAIARNVQCEFTIVRGGVSHDGSFSVDEGNYNILSLASQFVLKLNLECEAISGYNPELNFGYNSDNNLLRFFIQPDGTPTYIVIKNAPFFGLNLALGFSASWTVYDDAPYTESTQDCCVSHSRSIYLTSTTLQQTQSWSALTSSFKTNSILTQIPIQREPLLFITHTPSYPIRTTLTNTAISEIQIGLRDEQLNELEDFKLSFSFHLVIEEVKIEPFLAIPVTPPTDGATQPPEGLSPEEQERQTKMLQDYKQDQEQALQSLKEQQQKRLDAYVKKLQTKK